MTTDKLDIGVSDQDKVIITMCCDTEFLGTIVRRKFKPVFFTGKIRQIVVKAIIDFYNKYSKAPVENILDIIEYKIKRKKIKKEDKEAIEIYLLKIFNISSEEVNLKYLNDRLVSFMKIRIANTTLSKLQKLQERDNIDPEKLFDVMAQGIADVGITTADQTVEYFSEDKGEELFTDEVMTRFSIPDFDKACGGGLRTSNLIVLQGYTGRGKSWCINHLAKEGAVLGNSALLIDNERGNKTTKKRLRMSITGKTEKELRLNADIVRKQSKIALTRKSDIILLEDSEKNMPVDDIPNILAEIKQKTRKDIKLLLIDSADDLLPPRSSNAKFKIDKLTDIYIWLKNYAKNEELCIVTTSQSRRDGQTKWWLTSNTISDDINKIRKCTLGISINGNDKETEAGYLRLLIFKHNEGKTGAKCYIKTDFERGQFITTYGNYDKLKYRLMMQELGIFAGS